MDERLLPRQEITAPTKIAPALESLNQAGTRIAEGLASLTTGYTAQPDVEGQEVSYFDYPVLKAPVWRWEIVWYFFFGGLAAGCYALASLAALFGSRDDRATVRAGYYLSLLALLPCPPLLIKDLGRPERFLNMLRIFKLKSPMSMGVYGLLLFSAFSGLSAAQQGASDGLLGRWWGARLLARLPQRVLAVPGLFSAFFLGGYTGVLLTATSVPLWSRSKLLGGIFLTSAISTSSALISLILRVWRAPARTLHKLERLEWGALLLEMLGLLAFLRCSGRAARPLVGTNAGERGKTFWSFVAGSGLALPWLLQSASLSRKRPARYSSGLLISALVLIGGYLLRKTIVEAGHSSSRDARTTLWQGRQPRQRSRLE